MRLMRQDGNEYIASSKTEVKRWAQRIREDLRSIERAIEADDVDWLVEFAHDASGAAAEIENIADATRDMW